MIKVALIIERANIALGGAERSISELCQALGELGVDITLLAATGDSNDANIKVLCQGNNNSRTSLATFGDALQTHFKDNRYDIIHSTLPFSFADIYQPRGGSYFEAMVRNAASYDSPLNRFIKQRTHFFNRRRTELLNAEKQICTNDNGPIVAALSDYVVKQFTEHYKLSGDRVVLIRNAVKLIDQPNDGETENLRAQIYHSLNISDPHEASIFLFGANNFRLKGLSTILKALQLIEKTGDSRQIFVAIAGSGNIKKYSLMANKLGVADRISFLDSLNGISGAMAICDVAVLPTYYDPCSRFILEGISAAKPVITTTFNGAADFITDKKHGIILQKPHNPADLATAIRFYAQKNNAQQASNAIIDDKLNEEISIVRHARQMVELYKKIIDIKDVK
jgi:glycosyltransferase involved in cell wall biosynthesis